MQIIPLSIKEAEAFLLQFERHYKAPVEPICAIGVGQVRDDYSNNDGFKDIVKTLHGAAILGRKDSDTAELAHIYVDGSSQGYSLLYGACWRTLKALGYHKTIL